MLGPIAKKVVGVIDTAVLFRDTVISSLTVDVSHETLFCYFYLALGVVDEPIRSVGTKNYFCLKRLFVKV